VGAPAFLRRPLGVLARFWPYLACAAVALAAWDTSALKPFRLFVVVVHEACHVAAVLATGGQVARIEVVWDESGNTWYRGGFAPLVSAAGYVGSAALGALLIYTSALPQVQRLLLLGLGAGCMLACMAYSATGSLDFYLGIFGGLVLVSLAIKSQRAARVGATWMGVVLCLYSLQDFRTDLWLYPEQTDAGILARRWGRPWLTYPIALSWVAFSLYAMYRAMRALGRRPAA
jgi:hypothetical protein